MDTIFKSVKLKNGLCDPWINVLLCIHVADMCIGLKLHCCTGFEYPPEFITPNVVKDLLLQQDIKEMHNNYIANANHSKWDEKKCATSADLIEEFFCQFVVLTGCPTHI